MRCSTPVDINGRLRIKDNKLVNIEGMPLQLVGPSSHGLQWFGEYINERSVRWVRDDWKANVVRLAMYTKEGGYIDNRGVKAKVFEGIEAAISAGIYVIVDWHILSDNNPQYHQREAKEFFAEVSQKYGGMPNVIYEICNEPNGYTNWNQHIRPYAVDVINTIRDNAPGSIVIVGTPTWSQDLGQAARNPLSEFVNIMYAWHIYTGTHDVNNLDWVAKLNIPVFVTEWGVSRANGSGGVFEENSIKFLNFLKRENISWCAWNLSTANETSAMLRPGASYFGGWTDKELSQCGQFIRKQLKGG